MVLRRQDLSVRRVSFILQIQLYMHDCAIKNISISHETIAEGVITLCRNNTQDENWRNYDRDDFIPDNEFTVRSSSIRVRRTG